MCNRMIPTRQESQVFPSHCIVNGSCKMSKGNGLQAHKGGRRRKSRGGRGEGRGVGAKSEMGWESGQDMEVEWEEWVVWGFLGFKE